MYITQERLKELLHYDPSTGIFIWRVRRGKFKAGSVAGDTNFEGYWRIGLDDKRYMAHRLAWLYVYGSFPKDSLDHINGDRTDNRIDNLRDVSHRENCSNQGIHRTGHAVGTCYHKQHCKWMASIQFNGKLKYLGYYGTQEQAHKAYLTALLEHNSNKGLVRCT